jgi:hypothetical protein
MKKGTRFYLIIDDKRYLRTMTYVGDHLFEWDCGFSTLSKLRENTNKKSKVKYILIQNQL